MLSNETLVRAIPFILMICGCGWQGWVVDLVEDLRDSIIQSCWLLRRSGRLICCLISFLLSLLCIGLIIVYLFWWVALHLLLTFSLACFNNCLFIFILFSSFICNDLSSLSRGLLCFFRYSFLLWFGFVDFAFGLHLRQSLALLFRGRWLDKFYAEFHMIVGRVFWWCCRFIRRLYGTHGFIASFRSSLRSILYILILSFLFRFLLIFFFVFRFIFGGIVLCKVILLGRSCS